MVNVNFCMSAFFTPNSRLSDALLSFDRNSNGTSSDALSFYGNLRVTTTHQGFRKRSKIKGFGNYSASDTMFQCDEFGGKISVEQYFLQSGCRRLPRCRDLILFIEYQLRLQHAKDLPVVNIGSSIKDVFVPR